MQFESFWKWFQANRVELESADPGEVAHSIQQALQSVDPRLGAEVSDDDDELEVIITASGDPEAFPIAKGMVNAGIAFPNWSFCALKYAQGFDFVVSIYGKEVDASQLWFEPLHSCQRPGELGLRLHVPGPISNVDETVQALRLVLETGIGEEAAARISHLDVADVPECKDGLLPIVELADYVAWHRKRHEQANRSEEKGA
jgi:hypothetical protein